MKMSHLSILFVAIFIVVIISTDIRTDHLTSIADAKGDMDYYMDQAMDSAVEILKQEESYSIDTSDLDHTADSFFSSMYASLGIISGPAARENFRAYVPVIAVTTENGYFIMYNEEYTGGDGYRYMVRRWTELKPYYYQDGDFIYRFTLSSKLILYDKNNQLGTISETKLLKTTVEELKIGDHSVSFRSKLGGNFLLNKEMFPQVRQQAVVDCLERDLSWYISRHNVIASNLGITYHFGLPPSDTLNWTKTIDGTGIIVVFQGMPLVEGADRIYNRIAYSGAGIRKDNVFYIEQYSWYYLYHREGCPLLEDNLNIREEHYYSIDEVSKLGCYACQICDPMGVKAPDYERE